MIVWGKHASQQTVRGAVDSLRAACKFKNHDRESTANSFALNVGGVNGIGVPGVHGAIVAPPFACPIPSVPHADMESQVEDSATILPTSLSPVQKCAIFDLGKTKTIIKTYKNHPLWTLLVANKQESLSTKHWYRKPTSLFLKKTLVNLSDLVQIQIRRAWAVHHRVHLQLDRIWLRKTPWLKLIETVSCLLIPLVDSNHVSDYMSVFWLPVSAVQPLFGLTCFSLPNLFVIRSWFGSGLVL